ncbi:efflux RND transporter periplasmic adaptor subunit [Algoriphagus sp.]|uniref:efflux RND transporter periplasmic adaptor subunit n=1 Tax=Algoriphagus sp. TaxID=1872435 RepID=UPI0039195BD9
MKSTTTSLILLLFSLLLFSCGKEEEASEANVKKIDLATLGQIEKSKLQLLKVNSKSKQVEELISGRVIAKNQTQLFAEVQGLILPNPITLKAGNKFRKGDKLISIDSREFSLNLKAQKSAFLNALTGIMPDLKSDYSDNFQAWLTYLENIDLEAPLAELPGAKSKPEQFFITSRGIYTSYFGLKAQEERLSKYTIYAPYNGIFTQSMIDVGGLVSPGQTLGTIISSDQFEIETGVSLKIGSQLKTGDKISFTSNEVSGSWIGTVIRIGGTVDAQTQNIPVYFSIAGQNILPGMYLRGQFSSANYEDVFVIPNVALDRDRSVLVLNENLIVSKVVEMVQVFQDSTLVRGLAENDQVILTQFVQPMVGKKVAL